MDEKTMMFRMLVILCLNNGEKISESPETWQGKGMTYIRYNDGRELLKTLPCGDFIKFPETSPRFYFG